MLNIYALSSPQEAIYIDSLLYSETTKYTMGGFALLSGRIDVEIFKKAHAITLTLHDVFLSKIETRHGKIVQSSPHEPYGVYFKDFSTSVDSYRAGVEFILEDFSHPIPINAYPLAADMLLKVNEELYIWYTKLHHIMNDAFGHALFAETLSEIYTALFYKQELPVKERHRYVDFVEDDNAYLHSETFLKDAAFWMEKFKTLPEPISFSGSKDGLCEQEALKTERMTLTLSRLCYNDMLRICSENSFTSFHFLLAVLYTYLYRTKNRNDIVIGMPILNRNNKKFRNTSGMFMGMIPLRIKMEEGMSFMDLALGISRELRECYRHQRYPLGQIIKDCRSKEGFYGNIFDITFVYRKLSYDKKFGKTLMRMQILDTKAREESFSVEVDEFDDGDVNLFFNYNPYVIPPEEAEQMVRGFETLFLDVAMMEDKPLKELRIMPERVRCGVFGEKINFPKKRFEEIFAQTCMQYGAKEAVKYKDTTLTYVELDGFSSGIAKKLRDDFGLQKGDRVVCVLERTHIVPVVILALFKMGCVYVPADTSLPKDRINYMVNDCAAKLIISSAPLEAEVCVYIPDTLVSGFFAPIESLNAEDDAYIIYTSGTTGRPKGVVVPHQGIVNTVLSQASQWEGGKHANVLQFASLGFDASLSEIGMALLSGASLKIVPKQTILSPAEFIDFMNKEKVTVATLPPSYLSSLGFPEFFYLKSLITAGESPIEKDVLFYKNLCRVINAYGPTEISVCASWYEIPKDYCGGAVPIGKAIDNAHIYILDDNLNPLPLGSVGQICVGGAGVTRGYLNNPELTQQTFQKDLFFEGQKMYLTGDMGKINADGNLVFLGRKDAQIKLRGYRIEPEEVARVMEGLSFIDATSIDVHDEGESKSLVAYYTAKNVVDVAYIKKALLEKLPPYMIPSFFIHVKEFPLNVSGKIDKKALKGAFKKIPSSTKELQLPLSETEQNVSRVWSEILEIDHFETDTNFFDLGGHSLHAIKVMSKLFTLFGVRIGLREFFADPTLKGIASILDKRSGNKEKKIANLALPHTRALSPSERRIWVFCAMQGSSSAYNMPLLMDIEGEVDVGALNSALKLILSRHDILRTYYEEERAVCHIKSECMFEVQEIVTKNLTEALLHEIDEPFNLYDAPLFRLKILTDGTKKTLSFVIHHIISDGWSLQVLMNELLQAYEAVKKREVPELSPTNVSYASYATWLESEEYQELARSDRAYWLERFKHMPPELELPIDFSRGSMLSFKGASIHRDFELRWDAISHKAATLDTTPFTLFLAALYGVLHTYSSSTDIVIGSPVSGRIHPDIQKTCGIFINTLPLRVTFSPTENFLTLVARTKTAITEGHDHQLYPFDRLVNELELARRTDHQPLFDVMLLLQDTVEETMQAHDFTLKARGLESSNSHFDMTFFISQMGGNIRLDIEYNTSLFTKESALRFARHYENYLKNALRQPSTMLLDIRCITPEETNFLAQVSKGLRRNLPQKSFIHCFLEQAQKFPYKEAVVTPLGRFSYADIAQKAIAIAADIQSAGIEKGDFVGLTCKRDENLVAGMLGIMMSGASYVFMSAELPEKRFAKIVKTAHIKRVYASTEVPFVIQNITRRIDDVAPVAFVPDSFSTMAYCIFTSGTTGEPKGVLITRENLENLVFATDIEIYKQSDKTLRELCAVSGAFDVSIKQVCAALSCGHTLCMPDDTTLYDPFLLLEFIKKEQIHLLDISPSLLLMLMEVGLCETPLPYVKKLLIGSEAVQFSVIKRFMHAHPNVEVFNCYGPSECTVESVRLKIEATREYPHILPIGHPCLNSNAYVLDTHMNLCCEGVYGEIHLGGACVGAGYSNETKNRFTYFENERVYATGDIGRYNRFGEIEIAGRKDTQLKIRGYRIEPEEIEHCILLAPGVALASIAVFKQGTLDEMAAFYTGTADPEEVKKHVAYFVPSYALPAVFKKIDKMPLSAGGKIDKKALLAELVFNEKQPVQPEGLHLEIASLWHDLLGHSGFGMEDTFFDAGGNSVLLVQLYSRLNKAYPDVFTLAGLFSKSSIEAQAEAIKVYSMTDTLIEGITLPSHALSREAKGNTRLSSALHVTLSIPQASAYAMYLMFELYGIEDGVSAVIKKGICYLCRVNLRGVEDIDALIKRCADNLEDSKSIRPREGCIPLVLCDSEILAEEYVAQNGIVFVMQNGFVEGYFSEKIDSNEAVKIMETFIMIIQAAS
ncbi:non-ribosomal peptide synthetase [Sulfurospirillum barnesii]|uniref:Amino acid adenylation enzyme/thioester reductase family protein n=1 Tax=Sulfurospirillum barnesii (strain ATCC 700032 / DSM 10660 / SES-3) TaxID=760154 RepID=I3XVS9_SULBS|nr:non-ribosomal peptide synthetase [Sulfurospirillum barnesii]AFL68053.1 amino acid adenylation enzyme/thioester reductase family protein [Sulfurospirillum barnesii SES-3]